MSAFSTLTLSNAPDMMPYIRKLALSVGFFLSFASHAEIYMGMKPDSTLSDIKKMFPNATIAKVDAAWVTERDGFYRMSGNGLSGTIYLAFSDGRPFARERISYLEQRIAELSGEEQTDAKRSVMKSHLSLVRVAKDIAERPTDDALSLIWVRWVPVSPIPLARYITKYGPPTKTGFNDDDMRPYSSWPSKGVVVNLSDDGKSVLSSTFEFTAKETRDQCMATYKLAAVCD